MINKSKEKEWLGLNFFRVARLGVSIPINENTVFLRGDDFWSSAMRASRYFFPEDKVKWGFCKDPIKGLKFDPAGPGFISENEEIAYPKALLRVDGRDFKLELLCDEKEQIIKYHADYENLDAFQIKFREKCHNTSTLLYISPRRCRRVCFNDRFFKGADDSWYDRDPKGQGNPYKYNGNYRAVKMPE